MKLSEYHDPVCSIAKRECRHCSQEKSVLMGGYCVLKTGQTVREKKVTALGQRCNDACAMVETLKECPLIRAAKPGDPWEIKKQGQQVLL
jgi:hypothetical protein